MNESVFCAIILFLIPSISFASGGLFTDRSGTIVTGGTSQQLAASNPGRNEVIISNPLDAASQGIAAAENLCFNFGAAATLIGTGSICLAPGEKFVMENAYGGFVSTQAINVIAATTGHVYSAKEN